jgi:hypothetical protein
LAEPLLAPTSTPAAEKVNILSHICDLCVKKARHRGFGPDRRHLGYVPPIPQPSLRCDSGVGMQLASAASSTLTQCMLVLRCGLFSPLCQGPTVWGNSSQPPTKPRVPADRGGWGRGSSCQFRDLGSTNSAEVAKHCSYFLRDSTTRKKKFFQPSLNSIV